ncbi:MAG: DNA topoisomerase (ATP-hydrolyzing) subunit B [Candidatus Magasanikbacteria bacterium]
MSDQTPEEIDYEADQISVLEGLKAVRKRPGMYIGSTGEKGLHHMIWEVADNAIDEAMAGYCDELTIELLEDRWVRVKDNGRGIPVEEHDKEDMSAMEVVMTTLHAGGKFDEGGYQVSGGLHGVGVSVVNALSEEARAISFRDGHKWVQEYEQGERQTDVEKKEKTDRTGTIVEFRPDPEIFDTLDFKWDTILSHLRRQAYLTRGIHIKINDKRSEEEKEQDETIEHKFDENKYQFYFEGGIKSYIKHINKNREAKHDNIFYMNEEVDDIAIEVAFQYTDDSTESQHPFANNISTEDGGTHVSGFRRALTRTINKYARKKDVLDEGDDNFKGQDVREGLTSIISVKIPEPQFEGQTKAKLGNPEVRSAVEKSFAKELMIYLEENPKDAEAIMENSLLAAKARKAAKTARESVLRKSALSDNMTLPGKLADCSTRKAEDSELFIVEGDSAGGSAKQGRDRETQAILPLRGKVLNAERARIDKIVSNKELKSLIIALGTNIGEEFDIEDLRYDKIVILTDADVDGAHIRTLLLTFFFRYCPEVIEEDHLYIGRPPLYSVKKGSKKIWLYSDEELEEYKQKQGLEDDEGEGLTEKAKKKLNVQRYKGLGEMNPEELWETTMDPENRILKKVAVEDAEEASEVFDVLMGKDVGPRKKFILDNATEVKNLDV